MRKAIIALVLLALALAAGCTALQSATSGTPSCQDYLTKAQELERLAGLLAADDANREVLTQGRNELLTQAAVCALGKAPDASVYQKCDLKSKEIARARLEEVKQAGAAAHAPPASETAAEESSPTPDPRDDIDPATVTWIGDPAGVQGWKITGDLQVVFSGNDIKLLQDRTSVWPQKTFQSRSDMVANLWVIFKYNGKWYGASVEWMIRNAILRSKSCVAGGGIKKFDIIPESWKPQKGETIYLCVVACSRGKQNGVWLWEVPPVVHERTAIRKVVWE